MSNKETNSNLLSCSEKLNARKIMILMLQGLIIGGGGIIPGVSGGILCVAFGLYMPLMHLLANPWKEIPKSWKKWMAVGIGGCIGILLFMIIVDKLFAVSENMSKCLFAGLIVGTFPSLFREAKNPPKGNISKVYGTGKSLTSLLVALAISMPLFAFLSAEKTFFNITPNIFWYGMCGFIIGLGFVIPGLSSSPILIFLGLLKPMLDGALSFDFMVIIPVCVGVGAAVILLARLMNFIFRRFYSVAFFSVIGVVISSTLAIIPRKFGGIIDVVVCLVASIAGVIAALLIDRKLSRYEK